MSGDRLKRNREYRTVYKKGKSLADRWLVLYRYERGEGTARVGFSVSKKVGKSVVRNRVRRWLREAYCLLKDDINDNVDLVFIARVRTSEADFHTIKDSMTHLLKKAELLGREAK